MESQDHVLGLEHMASKVQNRAAGRRTNNLSTMPALRSVDARAALTLYADRDTLFDAASTLTRVNPVDDQTCACPVPGCARQQGDSHANLVAHLLADHFDLVKAHAAVLQRLVSACEEGGCCPLDEAHGEQEPGSDWRMHLAQWHMLDAWAIAQKLQRSFTYSSMPFSTATPKPTTVTDTATHTSTQHLRPAATHPLIYLARRRPASAPSHTDDGPTTTTTTNPSPGYGYTPGHTTTGRGAAGNLFSTPSTNPGLLAASKVLNRQQPTNNPGHHLVASKVRDIHYPCPLGCSAASMPGWQVPGHVLESHMDLLLQWVVDERRHQLFTPAPTNTFLQPPLSQSPPPQPSSWAALTAAAAAAQHRASLAVQPAAASPAASYPMSPTRAAYPGSPTRTVHPGSPTRTIHTVSPTRATHPASPTRMSYPAVGVYPSSPPSLGVYPRASVATSTVASPGRHTRAGVTTHMGQVAGRMPAALHLHQSLVPGVAVVAESVTSLPVTPSSYRSGAWEGSPITPTTTNRSHATWPTYISTAYPPSPVPTTRSNRTQPPNQPAQETTAMQVHAWSTAGGSRYPSPQAAHRQGGDRGGVGSVAGSMAWPTAGGRGVGGDAITGSMTWPAATGGRQGVTSSMAWAAGGGAGAQGVAGSMAWPAGAGAGAQGVAGSMTWPAGVASIVGEVSRMACEMADMRGALAEVSRRVARTVCLEDLAGMLQVLQPKLQGVASCLAELASSQAAAHASSTAATSSLDAAVRPWDTRLLSIASAVQQLAANQHLLLTSGGGAAAAAAAASGGRGGGGSGPAGGGNG